MLQKFFITLLVIFMYFQIQAEESVSVAAPPAVTDDKTQQEISAKEITANPIEPAKATEKVNSIANQKETEIPVHLESNKKSLDETSPWLRMIGSLFIIGILAGAAWFYTKKMKYGNKKSSLAPEIKILSQHYLGPKKSLVIVRVAGESILLGVTDHNVNMIKNLSLLDEDVPEVVPQNFGNVFNSKMNETIQETSQEKVKENRNSKNNENDNEEFSISGIKDVVTNRLKNMRSFQ